MKVKIRKHVVGDQLLGSFYLEILRELIETYQSSNYQFFTDFQELFKFPKLYDKCA